MPVQCERSEDHERKKREKPLPRSYTVLCRFIYPNLSVRLRKVYGFIRFSLFFALKTAVFSAFSHGFFPTASRTYANNEHREVPEAAQNTVLLYPFDGVL
jgi:hypothetical protein